MTNTPTSTGEVTSGPRSDPDAPRFPSLDALRAVHGGMLKRKTEAAHDPAFHEQLEAFIRSAQATGAVLDSDRDRNTAQTLIDYWVTVLFRATREDRTETVLDEFDPQLSSHELDDDQYPYGHAPPDDRSQGGLLLGTHRLVGQCIQQIEERRLAAIVGPSGSGRSTLLHRGLLPALRDGEALGSAHWRIYPVIEPGSRPLEQLAQLFRPADEDASWVARQMEEFRRNPAHLTQLLGRDGDQPALLVVDRFEEVFTLSSGDQRDAFVNNLVAACQAPSSATHCSLVLLMKAEYLARADALPELKPLLQSSIVYVAFTTDEIRDAIEKPASQIGLKFDEGLVDRLIQNVQGDPAALTLLQFTLRRLWDQRQKNRITWDAYNRVGGGRLALERAAESVFRELSDEEQGIAKSIFLQLVRPESSQDTITTPVRRTALRADGATPDQIDKVVNRFLDARLLKSIPGDSPETEQITIAHPALVGHWPRLVEWLSQERDRVRRRLRLRDAAKAWRNRNRDPGILWRGSLLEEAERYPDLQGEEEEFVTASRRAVDEAERAKIEAAEHEKRQAQALAHEQAQRAEAESRSRKRTQIAAALLVVALLAVIALAFSTYRQYIAAVAAHRLADRRRVALTITHGTQQLLKNSDRPAAALWFAGAMKEKPSELFADDVGGALARGVTANLRQQPVLSHVLCQKPDDASDDGELLTVNAEFCATPERILVVNRDADNEFGEVRLFDPGETDPKPLVFSHTDGPVRCAAVSPDGRWLATAGSITQKNGVDENAADSGEDGQNGNTGVVRIWDVDQQSEPLYELERLAGRVHHLLFSPDGQYLAAASSDRSSGQGALTVFRFGADGPGEVVFRWDQGEAVSRVAFAHRTPDSFWLAAACVKESPTKFSARIWQLPGDPRKPVVELPHQQRVNRVMFSRDGRWLVTAAGTQSDEDGGTQIWKCTDPEADLEAETAPWELHRQLDHQGGVASAELSPCGRFVVTASYDGSGVLFDRATGRWLASFRHKSSVYDAKFSPDGRFVVTGSRDGTARIWDVATREAAMPPMYHAGTVSHVHFDAESRRLLTCSRNTVRVWQLTTGNPQPRLLQPTGEVTRINLEQRGTHLVAVGRPRGNEPATCEVWQLEPGQPGKSKVQLPRAVACAVVDPEGRHLATAQADRTVVWWRIFDGKASEERRLQFPDRDDEQEAAAGGVGTVNHLAISEDGRLVAAGTSDPGGAGSAYVWDSQTGELVRKLTGCHSQGVLAVAFDRSGRRLATASVDDSARVWDLNTGEEIGKRLEHTADVAAVSFSRDESARFVVTASFDRTAVVWDTASGEKLATVRHDGYVTAASFHPDDPKYLVTTSSEGIAYVWFLASKPDAADSNAQVGLLFPRVVTVLEHGEQLQQATFDHAGNQVVTAGYYMPRLWGAEAKTPSASQRVIRVGTWEFPAKITDPNQAEPLAQLLGSRALNKDRQDIEFLKADELGRLWKSHSDEYRRLLAPSSPKVSAEVLARECEQTGQWFAASWYLGRLIEEDPGNTELLARCATAYAEMEDWQAATADAAKAIDQGDTSMYFVLALTQLADGDQEGYAATCEKIFEEITQVDDQFAINDLLWNLSLAPNATFDNNKQEILQLAERFIDRARNERGDPYALAEHRCLNTVGAVYYRAGEYQQAITSLRKSDESYEDLQRAQGLGSEADLQKGKIWNWLLLAMAHARLGQLADADELMTRAEELFGTGQNRDPQRYADALGTPSPKWYLRYSLRRLYDEAKKTVQAATVTAEAKAEA